MTQYLVAIHHPTDFDPGSESAATAADIDALNDEMNAKGVVVFVGGLAPVREAKSVRRQTGGQLLVTDGPYAEAKEHIGGFWVVNAASPDEALEWGRKAAIACRAPVEVRPFN
ncbi:MAG: YciI family protein [Devosia sp.]